MADDSQPGYLVVDIDDSGTCVGGLMVTDHNGLPLDFRFTDPITPTRLQRALYGGALERYLRADVVAGTLLGSIEVQPTMIMVDDDHLLSLPAAGCPVVAADVTRIGALGAVGTTKGDKEEHVLLQAAEDASPLRLTISDPDARSSVCEQLISLYQFMDALEPAQRVRKALGLIADGDIG